MSLVAVDNNDTTQNDNYFGGIEQSRIFNTCCCEARSNLEIEIVGC